MVCPVPSFVVQAVSYCVIKHVTLDCSRAWSIIISENFRLDLCTTIFQFRTPEQSEVVSVKSYCLCRGQEYIVHNLHCFLANKNGIGSVSD